MFSFLSFRRMPFRMKRRKHRKSCELARSALLIIDMQEYFLDPASHAYLPGAQTILPRVQHLLTLFRAAGWPIIFTRFAVAAGEDDPVLRYWGESVREGSLESRIAGALAALPGERVIRKSSYSAFRGTDLEEILRRSGAAQVVIAGVCTHLCCSMAAREAFDRGFQVFIVTDGTASFSQDLHHAALLTLSAGIATPVRSRDLHLLL